MNNEEQKPVQLTPTDLLIKQLVYEVKWLKIAIKQKGLNVKVEQTPVKREETPIWVYVYLGSIWAMLFSIVCKL